VWMSAAGIVVTCIFLVRRSRGAILAGILTSTLLGLVFGFISYVLLSLVSGRHRKLHWLMVLFTVLFVIRYAAL